MNRIQEVKERADIVKVAEYFGIKAKQCCPFHREKTASFSISKSKQIWKCFGCNKGGDAIALVVNLLNINAYEAAKQINLIFSLGVDFGNSTSNLEINKYQQRQRAKKEYEKWENKTFQLLCDYLHSLTGLEKYQEQDKMEYYTDIFIYGTEEDKLWFKRINQKVVQRIERKLRK